MARSPSVLTGTRHKSPEPPSHPWTFLDRRGWYALAPLKVHIGVAARGECAKLADRGHHYA